MKVRGHKGNNVVLSISKVYGIRFQRILSKFREYLFRLFVLLLLYLLLLSLVFQKTSNNPSKSRQHISLHRCQPCLGFILLAVAWRVSSLQWKPAISFRVVDPADCPSASCYRCLTRSDSTWSGEMDMPSTEKLKQTCQVILTAAVRRRFIAKNSNKVQFCCSCGRWPARGEDQS